MPSQGHFLSKNEDQSQTDAHKCTKQGLPQMATSLSGRLIGWLWGGLGHGAYVGGGTSNATLVLINLQ